MSNVTIFAGVLVALGILGVLDKMAEAVTITPEICGTDEEIRALIPNDYVAGWGLTTGGKLVTLLLNDDGGFAIIFRHPDRRGPTCFLATGREWQKVN